VSVVRRDGKCICVESAVMVDVLAILDVYDVNLPQLPATALNFIKGSIHILSDGGGGIAYFFPSRFRGVVLFSEVADVISAHTPGTP